MKKINLFLAGLTVFAFVACGNGESTEGDANMEVEVEVVEEDAPAMEEVVEETMEEVDSMATEVTEEVMEEAHEGHEHAEEAVEEN